MSNMVFHDALQAIHGLFVNSGSCLVILYIMHALMDCWYSLVLGPARVVHLPLWNQSI